MKKVRHDLKAITNSMYQGLDLLLYSSCEKERKELIDYYLKKTEDLRVNLILLQGAKKEKCEK